MCTLINYLTKINHTFITGASGVGKDLLASCAIKTIKQQQRDITVFVISMEEDVKENHYYADADIVKTVNLSTIISHWSLDDFLEWIRNCFEEFENIRGEKLLVLTKTNLIFHKFNQDKTKLEWLEKKVVTYLSLGNSQGIYLWLIGQTHLEPTIFNRCLLSVINLVLITHTDSILAHEYLSRTNFLNTNSRLSVDEMVAIASQSRVNRAVYYRQQWSPMPMITGRELVT